MLPCEGSRCSLCFPRPRTDVFQRALARKEGLVELERAVHVGLRVQQMQEGGPAIGEMEKESALVCCSTSACYTCCECHMKGVVTLCCGIMSHVMSWVSCHYMSIMTVKSHHMPHCDCHLTCDIVCAMACNGCPFSHPAYYACSIQVLLWCRCSNLCSHIAITTTPIMYIPHYQCATQSHSQ